MSNIEIVEKAIKTIVDFEIVIKNTTSNSSIKNECFRRKGEIISDLYFLRSRLKDLEVKK